MSNSKNDLVETPSKNGQKSGDFGNDFIFFKNEVDFKIERLEEGKKWIRGKITIIGEASGLVRMKQKLKVHITNLASENHEIYFDIVRVNDKGEFEELASINVKARDSSNVITVKENVYIKFRGSSPTESHDIYFFIEE